MATQYSSGFSTASALVAHNSIQSAIAECVEKMSAAGEAPDWATLKVVKKDLATGWTQMPTVTAYGVLLSSL